MARPVRRPLPRGRPRARRPAGRLAWSAWPRGGCPAPAPPPDTLPSPAGVLAALVGRARADEILAALGSAAAARTRARRRPTSTTSPSTPTLQGQAIGRRLADAGIAAADADGLGTYLGTTDPRNLPFYGRLGYVEAGAVALGPGRPHAHGAAPRSGLGELREPHDGVAVGAPVETHECPSGQVGSGRA